MPADVIEREWIAAGKGEEQIYLGLSKWAPESQGIPYLTVLQNTLRGTQRSLGMFEVFVERGKHLYVLFAAEILFGVVPGNITNANVY